MPFPQTNSVAFVFSKPESWRAQPHFSGKASGPRRCEERSLLAAAGALTSATTLRDRRHRQGLLRGARGAQAAAAPGAAHTQGFTKAWLPALPAEQMSDAIIPWEGTEPSHASRKSKANSRCALLRPARLSPPQQQLRREVGKQRLPTDRQREQEPRGKTSLQALQSVATP